MICKIFIRMDNDAFFLGGERNDLELVRILERAEMQVMAGKKEAILQDTNGNECGQLVIEDD